MNAELHLLLFLLLEALSVFNGLEDSLELFADVHGDDCRRRFACPESVVVAGRRNRYPQEVLILVDSLDDGDEEEQKEGVVRGALSRLEKVDSGIR